MKLKTILCVLLLGLGTSWSTAQANTHATARPRPRATGMSPTLAIRFHSNFDHMRLLERYRNMTLAERNNLEPRERRMVEEALNRELTFIFRGRTGETVRNAMRDIDADIARLTEEAKDQQGWTEERQRRLVELLTERDRVLGRGTGAEAHFVRDALGNALAEVRFKDTPTEVFRLAWVHIAKAMANPTTRAQLIAEMSSSALRDPLLTETIRRPAFRALMTGLVERFGETLPSAVHHLQNYFTRCSQEGGPRPSFRLVENAVEALLPLETTALAMRGIPKHSPARKALEKRLADRQRELEETGPQNIMEAIAQSKGPPSGQHAQEVSEMLNTISVDKDAGAGLGYIAGAMLRFKRHGGNDTQVERAMNRFLKVSERERRALNNNDEQRRFLENPDAWMHEFAQRQTPEVREEMRIEREANERVRQAVCERCRPQVIPLMGCAA